MDVLPPNDVKTLGQVFTPPSVVEKMLSLRKHHERVLEPSAGSGAFLSRLDNAVGVEFDSSVINYQTKAKIIVSDFFQYPISHKFNTIIGNPPYVRFQDIRESTKRLLNHTLFDHRSNLYLFFINKCINHLTNKGELILITPRDFLKATSARKLNERLYREGSMTHFYDLGDDAIFSGYSPNCAIWRWEKGRKNRSMETGGFFCHSRGQLWFGKGKNSTVCLGDYFDVKVGGVSGADKIFTNSKRGNKDFVYSQTAHTGETRKMIYNVKDKCLNLHKKTLINRRIAAFNENNWWMWGRAFHTNDKDRIYVNCKTRDKKPFFTHRATAYDGSVMALFPKYVCNINDTVKKLNDVDWRELGFICGGRFLFTQRGLQNAPVGVI